jgi:sulfopyruvate decarboxylase subunit beta
MIRSKAIMIISKTVKNNPVISANGFISRDLQEVADRNGNFYMIGSMGLASSIGLGIALKKPRKKVYVLDGDGNILMNLGSLATIGSMRPRNLIHIVLDNQIHESTGGQPTSATRIDISKYARASNYKVFYADMEKRLESVMKRVSRMSDGPIFVHVRISKSDKIGKRIMPSTSQIKKRFMKSLQ